MEDRNKLIKNLIPKDVKTVLDIGSKGDIFKGNYQTKTLDVVEKADIKQDLNINQKLNFPDNSFDSVTAFGAFHWIVFFSEERSISEIKRVLKLGGRFIVVNKKDVSNFSEDIKHVIKKYCEKELPTIHENYKPEEILARNGFKDIKISAFPTEERFTENEYLSYVQTMSVWNIVSENKKKIALEELEEQFKKIKIGIGVVRKIEIRVISGENNDRISNN